MQMENAIHQSTITRPSTPKVVPMIILTTSEKKTSERRQLYTFPGCSITQSNTVDMEIFML